MIKKAREKDFDFNNEEYINAKKEYFADKGIGGIVKTFAI